MIRRALYPGTFDPVTNGHLDIIRRARHLFDELVVAVAANPEKALLFPLKDREGLLRQSVRHMQSVRVISFHGLLVDLVQELKAVAVIRGLRAVSDFEFEFQMALANRELYARAETVFLMPSAEFIFVSSTIIKNIARHGGSVRHFVPAHVARKLASRLKDS
jgi:pantetheine-phosphate adenylyltransferase